MPELPPDLLEALESGLVTPNELRELIRLEAEALGYSFAEAVKLAEADELPATPLGTDLKFLVSMLAVAA